ncbi:hypothetical protein CBS101457_001341 [Exobasidium rhododendri]|nr:hypothetical protein CBS101457_001341 [Exobasidium rhododendri]
MLDITLVLNGKERVVVLGDLKTIKDTAAGRLRCSVEQLVFKISRGPKGDLVEAVLANEAWVDFAARKVPIYAFVKSSQGKRKVATEDADDLNSSNDSAMTIRSHARPVQRRRSEGVARAEGSLAGGNGVSTRHTSQIGRKSWSEKEDDDLWKRLLKQVESLPKPDVIYTQEQRDEVFSTIQRKYYSTSRTKIALEGRIRNRIKDALVMGRGHSVPVKFKALFPRTNHKTNRARQNPQYTDLSSSSEYSEEEEREQERERERRQRERKEKERREIEREVVKEKKKDKERESRDGKRSAAVQDQSSSSESASPPPVRTVPPRQRLPVRIDNHNPYATHAERARASNTITASNTAQSTRDAGGSALSWSESGRSRPAGGSSNTAMPPEVLTASSNSPAVDSPARSTTTNVNAALPTRPPRTASAHLQRTNACISVRREELVANENALFDLNISSTATSGTQPPAVIPLRPTQRRLSTADRITNFSDGISEAIVIKDEDTDEELSGVATTTEQSNEHASPLGSGIDAISVRIKAEYQSIREVVRQQIPKLFPLQRLDLLPPDLWAVDVSSWIKSYVLRDNHDKAARIEHLYAAFDEFFYQAYGRINTDYSVRRASFGTILVFLDLYHQLEDVEEVQDALAELFYQRTFGNSSANVNGSADWPSYDFCAAAAMILPTRPSWLISKVLQRANNCVIEQVPAPLSRVSALFPKIKLLLDKVIDSRIWLSKNATFRPLSECIHEPFFNDTVLSSLAALHRQTKERMSEKEADQFKTTLSALEKFNEEGRKHDSNNKAAEENFISERLILLSSPHRISTEEVQNFSSKYSLQLQGTNGPFQIKISSTCKTYHLRLLQFRDESRKRQALKSLRDHPTNIDLQYFSRWQDSHSWNRNPSGMEEERNWHRLCCDLTLHRERHRKIIRRIKLEAGEG